MKSCSFCDKTAREVNALVERCDITDAPAICDECAAGCVEIMRRGGARKAELARGVFNGVQVTIGVQPLPAGRAVAARFEEEKPPTPRDSRVSEECKRSMREAAALPASAYEPEPDE